MTHDELSIRTPCPKTWSSLSGDGGKRFCGECQLHVHSSDALTRAEARALVASSSERVCMRLVLNGDGLPRYKDSLSPHRLGPIGRFAGLALAAGMLAACRDRAGDPTHGAPSSGRGGDGEHGGKPPEVMGEICAPEVMGKVQNLESLGDVVPPSRHPSAPGTPGHANPPDSDR